MALPGVQMMIPCYLFDLDGTLFDCGHRLHHIQKNPKDWRAFFAACLDDPVIAPIAELVRLLAYNADQTVIYVSGRSDECRDLTLQAIDAAGLPDALLYMRVAGDHRDDDIVKGELLDRIIADGYKPVLAFDDRARVVKMWRARGIPCCQVAEGDF